MANEVDMDAIALRVPEHVLHQQIEDKSALLHLETEVYFGLDDVGTQMWQAIERSETLAQAHAILLEKYDVTPDVLRADLVGLVEELERHDLLSVTR